MTTHMPFDTYLNEETVAEIRHHWKGPFHFGAPDGIVVNVTKDDIWVREGILPDYPNNRAPQFNFDDQQLVIPSPLHAREDIQEPFVRDHEIPPEKYYPEGYQPGVLYSWPVDGELVAPVEALPEKMYQSMSENWRARKAYEKHLSELTVEND
jgi:hypothetical protein